MDSIGKQVVYHSWRSQSGEYGNDDIRDAVALPMSESVEFRIYGSLPDEAITIRTEVFVEEQGFEVEFDDTDCISVHIVGFIDGYPVSVCRIYASEGGSYWIGRIAVRREYRGRSLGRLTVERAEAEIKRMGGRESVLSAQVRASGFYASMGYIAEGEEYMDEFCPHILMRKHLGDRNRNTIIY